MCVDERRQKGTRSAQTASLKGGGTGGKVTGISNRFPAAREKGWGRPRKGLAKELSAWGAKGKKKWSDKGARNLDVQGLSGEMLISGCSLPSGTRSGEVNGSKKF